MARAWQDFLKNAMLQWRTTDRLGSDTRRTSYLFFSICPRPSATRSARFSFSLAARLISIMTPLPQALSVTWMTQKLSPAFSLERVLEQQAKIDGQEDCTAVFVPGLCQILAVANNLQYGVPASWQNCPHLSPREPVRDLFPTTSLNHLFASSAKRS